MSGEYLFPSINFSNGFTSRLQATLLVALLSTSLGISSAIASEYYLDATTGDDANPINTATSPWKTLAKVAGVLGAGDTVYLKRDEVWRERLTIPVSGTAQLPVTFTAYGVGADPVIHGGRSVAGTWSGPVDGVYSTQNSPHVYFVIENDQMIPHATDASCSDGKWYVDNGSSATLDSIVYYRPPAGTTPEENNVEIVPTYTGFQLDNKNHIVISDLTFKMLVIGIYGRTTTDATQPVNNISVLNSDFLSSAYGVLTKANAGLEVHDITISGGYFSNNLEAIAIYATGNGLDTSRNITITYNVLENGGLTTGSELWREFMAGDPEAIGLQNVSNSIISHNTILNGDGLYTGIDLWVNTKTPGSESSGQNNEYSFNYVENVFGSGIVPGGQGPYAGGHSVFYNVVINTGSGQPLEAGNAWGGIRLNQAQSPPSTIYNNLLVGNDTNILLNGAPANYDIKNNVSYMPVHYHIRNSNPSVPPNTLDNNLYYPNPANGFRVGDNEYDFAQWISATGLDSQFSFTDDAVFVDPGNGDYHLSALSPAIGSGADVGLTADHDGAAIVAMPDIGAFEYQFVNLALTMTADPEPVSSGATLSYTISVTNNGPGGASDITVTDELPENIDNVAASSSQGGCTVVPRTSTGKGKNKVVTPASVTCELATLARNDSASVSITGTVLGNDILSNTATVSTPTEDSDISDNSATVESTVSGGGGKPCKKNCNS